MIMDKTVQYVIVGIVVALAFILAIRSIYRLVTHKKSALNPCDSCALREACQKKSNERASCTENAEATSSNSEEIKG